MSIQNKIYYYDNQSQYYFFLFSSLPKTTLKASLFYITNCQIQYIWEKNLQGGFSHSAYSFKKEWQEIITGMLVTDLVYQCQ